MDPENTRGGPQLDSSEEENNHSTPSSLPPNPQSIQGLMQFMAKQFPKPTPKRTNRSPSEINQLLNDPLNRPTASFLVPNPQLNPGPRVNFTPLTAMLPYILGGFAFFFGSGLGIGWLLKGWYSGSGSKKSKSSSSHSSTPSTLDPMTGEDYSKLMD